MSMATSDAANAAPAAPLAYRGVPRAGVLVYTILMIIPLLSTLQQSL